jgi:hypothetical protein
LGGEALLPFSPLLPCNDDGVAVEAAPASASACSKNLQHKLRCRLAPIPGQCIQGRCMARCWRVTLARKVICADGFVQAAASYPYLLP